MQFINICGRDEVATLMPKSMHSPPYYLLVESLIDHRRQAGVSQVELARRIGKSQVFVSNIERRLRRVDVIEYYAIAQALGLDPVTVFSELVGRLPDQVEI
jgi:transcriptional regulator with XRE-family HTH domain